MRGGSRLLGTRNRVGEPELTIDQTLGETPGPAFDSLDDRVTAAPGVERVVWQDREIMLGSASIDPDELARRVAPLLNA